jgi:hypothetical protein
LLSLFVGANKVKKRTLATAEVHDGIANADDLGGRSMRTTSSAPIQSLTLRREISLVSVMIVNSQAKVDLKSTGKALFQNV